MSQNSVAQQPKIKDSGLLRSSGVVSFFTMLSRFMGLARDIIFARVIGAEALADVFFVAFKIPNFFRRLFAEGAFAQAFVPILGEYREKGSQAAVKALIDRVTGTLGISLLALTLGGEVQSGPKTICKCTSFGHDDVRRLILEKNLRAIPQVMQELQYL